MKQESRRKLIAWGLCLTCVVFTMGAVSLVLYQHVRFPSTQAYGYILEGTIGFLPYATVGALIASKRRNVIGWVFLGTALVGSVQGLTGSYGQLGAGTPLNLPLESHLLLVSSLAQLSFVFGVLWLVVLFPTGRVHSHRWKFLYWSGFLGMSLVFFANLFTPDELYDDSGVANPLGFQSMESLVNVAATLALAPVGIMLFGGLVQLGVRFKGTERLQRLQIKWFVFAAFVGLAILFVPFPGKTRLPDWLLWTIAPTLLPIAAGIAILKHGLYGIDVVIKKTVVYGALAALITAVYVGVVVGIGTVVGAGDKPNLGLSLAATAIVAVAFRPVRERVQRFANKLIYGERVTPYEAITGFSHRMAESLSLDSVLPQMAEAAAKGVGGIRSRVKLSLPQGGEQIVTWPDDSNDDSFDRTLAVVHQNEAMGEISVSKPPGEQINSSEDKLLNDLASQAGLAMRNLRLTAELQQKLVELQASRQRIVKAQDEERRRMERDIHDGAQQQLVSMSIKLGLVKTLLTRDADKAGAMLQELKQDASEAVETLRDLARGLFPEILTEQGLKSALESHITKMNLNATVVGDIGRFDLQIEANVYFCIREALQNASKHAQGAPIVVSLAHDDGKLSFTVKDEGPGFDSTKVKLGSGLQNMRDRVEALGGTFKINSGAGLGTEVAAVIPSRVLDEALP